MIAINKNGEYKTLTITADATDKQIYDWGMQNGVDLRKYGLDLKV